MNHNQIVLFFRKRREAANYSIEGSFDMMCEAFSLNNGMRLVKFTSSHISKGIFSRLRGIMEAREHRGDINHVTGDVHYLVFGLPSRNTILTIHDCGFINRSNPLNRILLKWLWLDLPVRHCRYITAVSEATKRDIVRLSGCNPDKVVIIPTIISAQYKAIHKDFDSCCPKILHIGLAPNKNFERHVEAVSGLACRMHIVGKLREHHVEILRKYNIQYTNEYDICDSDMLKAYVESDVVLFASTFEGFGMPIIEGQSVGRVVVTSSLSSMPEVAGDGACLVDPYSVNSIRVGLERVIYDADYRNALISAGFKNAQRFSPRVVASQYQSLYRKVLDA